MLIDVCVFLNKDAPLLAAHPRAAPDSCEALHLHAACMLFCGCVASVVVVVVVVVGLLLLLLLLLLLFCGRWYRDCW